MTGNVKILNLRELQTISKSDDVQDIVLIILIFFLAGVHHLILSDGLYFVGLFTAHGNYWTPVTLSETVTVNYYYLTLRLNMIASILI